MKLARLLILGTAALALNACGRGNAPVATQPAISEAAAAVTTPAAPVAAAPTAAPAAAPVAAAPACNYNFPAGSAVGGQAVTVDTCSVKAGNPRSIEFVYYLGQEKIESSADCPGGNWTTYPERAVHYPQSAATQTMLNAVCQAAGETAIVAQAPVAAVAPAPVAAAPAPVAAAPTATEDVGSYIRLSTTATVFDPPSNVRSSPNGSVICQVDQYRTINIMGSQDTTKGLWHTTDACGDQGWIHTSQVQF